MGGNATSVIIPVRASARKLQGMVGFRERQDTYRRGKAYPIHWAILRGDRRVRVKILKRSARVGCNRYISFIFTEGQSAFPTIILSLNGYE